MSTLLFFACIIGWSSGITQCPNKTELDACLAKIVPHMPKTGFPDQPKQLANTCRTFKGGMRCVDGYTAQCMSQVERAGLEENLKGARYTLAFLCDDPIFQREYLSHGECIKEVREDWDRCHNHFKHLVGLQHTHANLTQAQRDHNICCIREGFLNCVYGMSYLKCGKLEAVFLKKMTATLSYSDVHQEKCRNVTRRVCSSSPPSLPPCSSALHSLVLLLLFISSR
ncbi:uncharacterized protein LOC121856257 [Homarus americanus]|uniref:uncharacterized protein LOC121856257 n=1 Tax=Homarus americanus TaxID=6706 RepID=UPI001C44B7BE|nr:uncharacterized protein LOC121856257 [Homarus americanus]